MPMPGWWKKTGKSKDEQNSRQLEAESPQGKHLTSKMKLLNKIEWSNRYSDDASISRCGGSSRSRELPTRSHRFSGVESDWAEKRDLPLPRPSISDLPAGTTASASNSVSSVSSSGSSAEDHATDHTSSQSTSHRGNLELKFNTGSRNPDAGTTNYVNGVRSPASGSRTTSRPTSPLHPKLMTSEFDNFSLKCEESKKQLHPLPLPPNSPTSPPQASLRPNLAGESSPVSPSAWKKGKLLGRGTFGHVYLGFNSVSGQMCAIKEVRLVSDDQSSKECLKQLNQEINLLSQLSHPHIVRYYGSELSNTTLSVYLEYVSGGSIYKLLQEYGPFTEPVIQNYTKQILLGLAYLHGRNTVHRDIKGANILVDPNGEIKLADFGMAKHITTCTSVLSFKGSPYWMAPEVVMNTNGYSHPVDIWSLGCTIIEMATSKPPWSQYEGVAAIFKIGNSREIPEIPGFLSPNAKSFVKLCLQRDPSLRPTALQLLDHAFLRSHGDTSPSTVFSHRFETEQRTRDATLRSPRDDVRKMVSLPVSPSSSPLRQWGGARATPLLSPPHPAFAFNHQTPTHRLLPNFTYPSDVYSDATILKPQAYAASSPLRRS